MADSVGEDAKDRVAEIYERYAHQVAAYAMRRASATDAADVVAETFLVAWRRHEAVPDEPSTLPWLFGVARRVLANQRRTKRRRSRLSERLASEFVHRDVEPPPLDEIDELGRVAEAIRLLSDDDAEVLRLTAWEGLSPTEIATAMGIGPDAARQRLRRARQRLRKQLAVGDPPVVDDDPGAPLGRSSGASGGPGGPPADGDRPTSKYIRSTVRGVVAGDR